MAFFLDKNASREELTDAVNYLLANFIESKNININSGEITAQTTGISGYLYRYLSIKYADSWDGQVNFSNSPTNRLYYGVYNSDAIIEPTDFTKYLWTKVVGGFGTTKFVWYHVTGGRQIQILVDTARPFANYFPDAGLAIDLDLLTVASVDDLTVSFDVIGTINNLIDQTQYGPQYQDFTGVYVPYRNATYGIDLNQQSLVNISHLGVGTTTSPNILIRVVGDNGSLSRIAMRGYSSDANGSALRVAKFRGTYAAPQVPQSGDSLGRFEFAGYATTSADGLAGAYWEAVTTEIWSAIAHGTKVNLYVTPNATTTSVVAMTINQDKSITFPGPVVVSSNAPVTKTADFTLAATECWIINNKAAATCTVTLPAASLWTGRAVTFKNMQAFTLVSASSNVVPIDSTTAGTTILLNVVGNWATMVSDGTNWVIMQQAPNNILLLE